MKTSNHSRILLLLLGTAAHALAQLNFGIAVAGSCLGSQGLCVMLPDASPRLLGHGGISEALQVSPDGRKIAFLDLASGSARIADLNGAGSEALPVNLMGLDIQMAWSPDSTRIAFASPFEDPSMNDPEVRKGHKAYSTAIYVLNLQTKKVIRRSSLGQNRWISWAPDGHRIVFSGTEPGSMKGNIMIVDSEAGNPRTIYSGATNNVMPAWSPLGDRIAFLATAMGANRKDVGLFVVNPDGTGARRVSAGGGPAVTWSPDGRYVLTGSLLITVATGAAVEVGTELMIDAAFSPDGRSIVYRTSDQRKGTIIAVEVDGRNRRKIADGSFFAVIPR